MQGRVGRAIVAVVAAAGVALVALGADTGTASGPISFSGAVPASQIAGQLAAQLPRVVDRTTSVDNTPPGNSGYMDATSYAKGQATGNCQDENPHFCDWEKSYRDFKFRGDALYDLRHPGPGDMATSPRPGVVIIRTPDGVPHIFGVASPGHSAEQNLSYGGGVAQAQDRLFQMELFRRAAEGRLSELLGPSYLDYDRSWRAETETPQETTNVFRRHVPARLQSELRAYVDGVNSVIDDYNGHPAQAPVEFGALQDLPIAHWSVTDTYALAVLETKSFGEDGGHELDHAVLGQHLLQHYGKSLGLRIFNDVHFRNDPGTDVTVPRTPALAGPHSSARNHYSFISYRARDTLRLLRGLPGSLASKLSTSPNRLDLVQSTIRRMGLPHEGSNALVIDGRHTTTRRPILYGGPQVGYNVPNLFYEFEVRGGSVAARGAGFAGLGPVVLIGHGPSYAYTTTSGQDDEVDTYRERIRHTPGDSSGKEFQFFRDHRWYPVHHIRETIQYRPSAPSFLPGLGGQPLPIEQSKTVDVYRTWHRMGRDRVETPIFDWDKRDGIAFSKLRAFWDREWGGIIAYGQYQSVRSYRQFRSLAYHNTGALNQYYADTAGHILYIHAGSVPVRVRGHDPRLPAPGNGSYDWRGLLPPSKWPQVLDPPQGWFANWNNRPAANWLDSADGTRWGRFHHIAIIDRLVRSKLRRGRRLSVSGVEAILKRAATAEIRAATYFRPFLTGILPWAHRRHIKLRADERQALTRVALWNRAVFYPDGARTDPKRVAVYRDPAATIWYRWIYRFQDALYRPWFAPVMSGYTLANFRDTIDSPDQGADIFEDNFDPLMLSIMQGRRASLPVRVDYLRHPRGRFPHSATAYRNSVMAASRRALDATLSDLSKQYGPNQARWLGQSEVMTYSALGAGFVPDMPFENKGTFIQVIALGGRGR